MAVDSGAARIQSCDDDRQDLGNADADVGRPHGQPRSGRYELRLSLRWTGRHGGGELVDLRRREVALLHSRDQFGQAGVFLLFPLHAGMEFFGTGCRDASFDPLGIHAVGIVVEQLADVVPYLLVLLHHCGRFLPHLGQVLQELSQDLTLLARPSVHCVLVFGFVFAYLVTTLVVLGFELSHLVAAFGVPDSQLAYLVTMSLARIRSGDDPGQGASVVQAPCRWRVYSVIVGRLDPRPNRVDGTRFVQVLEVPVYHSNTVAGLLHFLVEVVAAGNAGEARANLAASSHRLTCGVFDVSADIFGLFLHPATEIDRSLGASERLPKLVVLAHHRCEWGVFFIDCHDGLGA